MEGPLTKAELKEELDLFAKRLTRRFYLIGGLAALLFVIVLEIAR